MRDYDRLVWPHAQKGFFQLGKRIPEFLAAMELAKRPQNKGLSVIEDLDPERFETACGWFTTLPNYMFTPALSAALLQFAYQQPEIQNVDRACGSFNLSGFLLEPLAADAFIGLCAQCYAGHPPLEVREFLERENTH